MSFFEIACEIVGRQKAAQDAWIARGTNLHGWVSGPTVETVETVQNRLESQAAYMDAYSRTPEGRFLDAAVLIWKATGDERLLQCHSRGLESNGELASRLLATMEGPAADAAREALADL